MWPAINIILALAATLFWSWGNGRSKAVTSPDYSFMAFWFLATVLGVGAVVSEFMRWIELCL